MVRRLHGAAIIRRLCEITVLVIRPNQDTDVRMTAVVTKGESSKTVYFDITVLKKTSGSGSGSGSGGGGGTSGRGSSGNQIIAPITTPAPLPENNPAEPGKPGAAVGDMDASHWAYTYVEQLKKAGIVSGDENGNFEPERTITRAEYMKMLAAAFALTGEAEAFDDVAADAWYLPYITGRHAQTELFWAMRTTTPTQKRKLPVRI